MQRDLFLTPAAVEFWLADRSKAPFKPKHVRPFRNGSRRRNAIRDLQSVRHGSDLSDTRRRRACSHASGTVATFTLFLQCHASARLQLCRLTKQRPPVKNRLVDNST
jgi:hypothetical protein